MNNVNDQVDRVMSDMEKHNLKFSFSSVEDLYIKDGVSKYWFERYL